MSITLSSERYEEIKRTVVELFVKYDVNCVPVNGFEIATKMGIKIHAFSAFPASTRKLLLMKSEDGFVVEKRENEWFIYYNDDKGYGRINNTLLHEIGHIILDHTEDSELADKEVKFFAKYALVPPVLVHKMKLSTAEEIEERFNVSAQAARYALSYYHKWLNYGEQDYTDYEITLLRQFHDVA